MLAFLKYLAWLYLKLVLLIVVVVLIGAVLSPIIGPVEAWLGHVSYASKEWAALAIWVMFVALLIVSLLSSGSSRVVEAEELRKASARATQESARPEVIDVEYEDATPTSGSLRRLPSPSGTTQRST